MPESFYPWLMGALWSLVVFLLGGFLGDLKASLSVRGLRREMEAHETLPAHPISDRRHAETERRLDEIEQRIDRRLARIEEKLDARGR